MNIINHYHVVNAMPTKFKAYFALAIICIVWGGTFLAVSVGIESLPPLFLSGFRQVISGTLLIGSCVLLYGYKVEKQEWKQILIFGSCIVLFSNTLIIWSLKILPTGLVALLMTTILIWVTLLNLLIKRKVPGIFTLLGLGAGIGGMILIFTNNAGVILNRDSWLSIGMLLSGTFFWALGSFLIGGTTFRTSPFLIAGVQLFIFGIILLIVSFGFEKWHGISFPPSTWGSLFYLVVLDQMIAYAAYIYALRKLPVALVSIFVYINPIVALFLGWFIRNESFTLQMAFGVLIIFIGVYLLNKNQP